MRNLLLGNGINIQFGGMAYTSSFIVKRIKYGAKVGIYNQLFGNIISGEEIIKIFEGLAYRANSVKKGEYDKYIDNNDMKEAIGDFKCRYKDYTIEKLHDVMLEDWFLLLYLFFLENEDLKENKQTAIQGFEQLILDAIYNGGKIQEIYKNMRPNKKVKRHFKAYDNVFTLNYDDNIEMLTGKKVYHLHGDFSVLTNSENENNVAGYIRMQDGTRVFREDMRHCYCNALLNYSGMLKKQQIDTNARAIEAADIMIERINSDAEYRRQFEKLKINKPDDYRFIKTKIEHPELSVATEYYFSEFENMEGELDIIGMSPNNDAHIFDAILNNNKLTKVTFYYMQENERKYIEDNYPKELFVCERVNSLWGQLNCQNEVNDYNYGMPPEVDKYIDIFNKLSFDEITPQKAKQEVNKISRYEMNRLCRLVKEELHKRNSNRDSLTEKEFIEEISSISLIALREGVLPTVLFLVCVMNFNKIKD